MPKFVIEVILAFLKATWEKRPMKRKKNGSGTTLVADLNLLSLLFMIAAAGFYIKNQMGIKSGTEVALEGIKNEISALKAANQNVLERLDHESKKIVDPYRGLDALDRRVALLEMSRRVSPAEEDPR